MKLKGKILNIRNVDGKEQNDEYEILGRIGRGGSGDVYVAKEINQLSDKPMIALKFLERKYFSIDDISKEIDILKKVSAPDCNKYISCYYSFTITNKYGIISMEYIPGPSLDEYVKPIYTYERSDFMKWMPWVILPVIKAITIALKIIHEHKILHNDIKPQNIVIDKKTLIPKLVDFGIACETKNSSSSLCMKPLGEIGQCCKVEGVTYSYSPPEYVLYDIRYPQSDIWSLGSSMYSIFTRRNIWDIDRPSHDKIKEALRISKKIKRLDSKNELLDKLVNGMTLRDITKRLTSVEILVMLENYDFSEWNVN